MTTHKLTESAKGVYIIAATPFTDEGALDLQSVDTLTDFYLRCGVHGFTLLGIMGEAPKLSPIKGIAGRYISIAKGPRQDKSPKISAGRANEPDMGSLSKEGRTASAQGR